jgi:hypothetical protein
LFLFCFYFCLSVISFLIETRGEDDDDDIEFLEALARSQDDATQKSPPRSANPFVSLYDAHPELELERTTIAQV